MPDNRKKALPILGAQPAPIPETEPPNPNPPATNVARPLPHDQSSMLHDIASLALGYAQPIAPGQVTPAQQAVLQAWQTNAHSSYSQYMLHQGLSAIGQNPDALFSQEALAAQAGWSHEDLKDSMAAMSVSTRDYDEWQKLVEAQKEQEQKGISSLFQIAGAIVGGVVGTFVMPGVGTAAGAMMGSSLGGAVGSAVG